MAFFALRPEAFEQRQFNLVFSPDIKKAETLVSAGEESGGNLLSRKLYNHYHRQGCV